MPTWRNVCSRESASGCPFYLGCPEWLTVHLCKCASVGMCPLGSWGPWVWKAEGWMGPCAQWWMELRMRVMLISWLLWPATSSRSKSTQHTQTHAGTCLKRKRIGAGGCRRWGGEVGQRWKRKWEEIKEAIKCWMLRAKWFILFPACGVIGVVITMASLSA